MNQEQYIEVEGIRCYGINNNLINRKRATITEEDKLKQISAQDLIEESE